MSVKFNDFNSYNNYNFAIGQGASNEAKKVVEKADELVKSDAVFKGLDDDTDLLTKNTQYLYGTKFGKFTAIDKDLADSTNEILASLGYNYKVSPADVASVANGLRTVVEPGLKLVRDGAVAANIMDPNGPFAELFI